MKKILLIPLLFLAVGCNRHKIILGKKFLYGNCLCGFSYARIGSGKGVYFEDSYKFYKVGDTLKGESK